MAKVTRAHASVAKRASRLSACLHISSDFNQLGCPSTAIVFNRLFFYNLDCISIYSLQRLSISLSVGFCWCLVQLNAQCPSITWSVHCILMQISMHCILMNLPTSTFPLWLICLSCDFKQSLWISQHHVESNYLFVKRVISPACKQGTYNHGTCQFVHSIVAHPSTHTGIRKFVKHEMHDVMGIDEYGAYIPVSNPLPWQEPEGIAHIKPCPGLEGWFINAKSMLLVRRHFQQPKWP